MTPCGLDTETELISPGRLAPPMVCVSWAEGESAGVIDHMRAEPFLYGALTDPSITLYGLTIAYDMAVVANEYPALLRPVFDAYWDGRIRDVGLDQRLIDIAKGQVRRYEKAKGAYSLAGLCQRLLKVDLLKEGTPRLEYGRLRHVPVEEYSDEEIEYAKLDAVYPLRLHAKQLEIEQAWIAKWGKGLFADAGAQARHAFSLHLATCWGVRADAGRCEVLMESLERDIEECRQLLVREGLVRDNGTRNIAAARERMVQVMAAKSMAPLKTDKGGIKLDQEATDLSGDDVLKAYTRFVGASGLRTKVKDFWYGSKVPLQPRYHTLKDTGRTSCSKPTPPTGFGIQIQNPPRIGGARECLEPREGYIFIDADFTAAETHALAQTLLELFGKSALADLLNSGVDTHCYTAANLLGLTYEEVDQAPPKKRKWYRDFAKAFAFGVPGGLGVGTFVRYATVVYGVEMSEAEARQHIHNYKRIIFPDIGRYLDLIGRHCDRSNVWYYPWSKRWRGGLTYTACANGNFQVRTADGALDALDAVQRACYTQTDSPLWGCRPFGFIHDQILAEAPVHRAREAAEELGKVMAETYNKWVPDVPTKAEPSIMWRWSKVDPAYDEQGNLTVSDPENAPGWARGLKWAA